MKNIRFVLFAISLIIVVISFVYVWNRFRNQRYKINVNRATVIKEMRELNRLETASYTLEKIIDAGATSNNRLSEFLFGDKLLLIAHGEVIAGFDLSRIEENDIRINDSSLTITLPPPQILVTALDNQQTRVYDRDTGILSKGERDLESEARQAAEESIRMAACEADILGQASNNARKQLTALFQAMGFEEVTITIPSGNC